MSEPLKLLVYNPLSTRMGGGGDRWLAEVLPRLVPQGFEITLMTSDFIPRDYRDSSNTSLVRRIHEAGVRYQEIPTILKGRLNHPIIGPSSIKKLRNAIALHDLTYFMNAYAFQDVFLWLATKLAGNQPVISAQHASMFHGECLHDLYMRTISCSLLSEFAAYHVLNNSDLETYEKWCLKNTFLIPSGVDTETFSPLGRKSGPFTVLYVGRLDYEKGIDVFLDAIQIINRDFEISENSIIFRICGSGPFRDPVTSFAEETPNVHYMGYVTKRELLEHYRTARLFVMPSRRETFGLVAMEAMSCGLPVITSDISGPRSFVREDFGDMIPAGRPKALAFSIKNFLELWQQQPDEYEEMGRQARHICERKYNWENVVDRIANMIFTVYENSKR